MTYTENYKFMVKKKKKKKKKKEFDFRLYRIVKNNNN